MTNEDGLKINKKLVPKYSLIVKHEGKDLVIAYPFFDLYSYRGLSNQIRRSRLIEPTISEVMSVIYSAHQSKNKYSKEIIKEGHVGAYWRGFSGIRWAKEGVYVQDNPKTENGFPVMNEEELQKHLPNRRNGIFWSSDGTIRFTPYGYFSVGNMNSREFEKNNLVKILLGEEGTSKGAKLIKDKYHNCLDLRGNRNYEYPTTTVSKLATGMNSKFNIDVMDDDGRGTGGFAFGVEK